MTEPQVGTTQPVAPRKCLLGHPASPGMTACHKTRGHLGPHESLSPLGSSVWRWH